MGHALVGSALSPRVESHDLDKRSAWASTTSGKQGGAHPNQGLIGAPLPGGVTSSASPPPSFQSNHIRCLDLLQFVFICTYLYENYVETNTKISEEAVVLSSEEIDFFGCFFFP